jgi:hypothetical protein
MTDRAKTILAFILIMMAGWSTHVSGVSDELSQDITKHEIRIATHRMRREVLTNRAPVTKGIGKMTAQLRDMRSTKSRINRSEDFALVAVAAGAAAFLATPVPYIFVAGGAVFLGCSMGFYWLAG